MPFDITSARNHRRAQITLQIELARLDEADTEANSDSTQNEDSES